MDEWKLFAERFLGPANAAETPTSSTTAAAASSSFAIDPYGEMSICVLSQRRRYDCGREASARAGSVPRRRPREEDHARHQVHGVRAEGDVRHVSRQRRARERRSGVAGRFSLPGRAPARARCSGCRSPRTATANTARAEPAIPV